jgi:hypothetical protein
MNPANILGKKADDPVVDTLLTDLGTLHRPYIGDEETWEIDPSGRPYSWVKVLGKGLEFTYCDSAYYEARPDSERLSGDFTLTSIGYYLPSRWNDFKAPAQDLPMGLSFSDNRQRARAKLAEFESSRRSFHRDWWNLGWAELSVQFEPGDRGINRIALSSPLKPWPAQGRVVLNISPEDWVSLLGRKSDDPEVGAAFEPLDLRLAFVREPWAKEVSLNFQEKCGLVTTFVTSDRVQVHRENQPVPDQRDQFLALAAFHRERDEDITRQWEGALPFKIGFDDSPEVAYAKVGRAADERSEAPDNPWDFSAAAFWHFDDYVLRIFCDTVRNCVRQVSIIDRKYWMI